MRYRNSEQVGRRRFMLSKPGLRLIANPSNVPRTSAWDGLMQEHNLQPKNQTVLCQSPLRLWFLQTEIAVTAFIILLFLSTGCHLQLDQGPPGTIGVQRARAAVHDPFPSNELGPEIMGGRPLGFDLPAPHAESLQDPQTNPYARRGARAQAPVGF